MLGLSYFVVYLLLFLIFHFPSTQESIPYALAVIAFGGGIALWHLCVVIQNGFCVLHNKTKTKQQVSLWFVGLFLIWTAALPTVAFLFPAQPLLQLGYASAFTVIVVGSLPDGYLKDNTVSFRGRFGQYAPVGLLALVPADFMHWPNHSTTPPHWPLHSVDCCSSISSVMFSTFVVLLRELDWRGLGSPVYAACT